MLKRKEFWISLITTVVCYFALGFFTGYDGWFPFVHYFNIPTVMSWGAALYLVIENKWTVKKCVISASAIIFFTLPHILFMVLVYSSWICVGASLLLTVLLFIKARKIKRASN